MPRVASAKASVKASDEAWELLYERRMKPWLRRASWRWRSCWFGNGTDVAEDNWEWFGRLGLAVTGSIQIIDVSISQRPKSCHINVPHMCTIILFQDSIRRWRSLKFMCFLGMSLLSFCLKRKNATHHRFITQSHPMRPHNLGGRTFLETVSTQLLGCENYSTRTGLDP